ncbi:MAG: Eco57I restriction-modification methylase domain-containing protein [Pirellulaceae bacterium]
MTGHLTAFAADQQQQFDAITSEEERKVRGHFGTPPEIANFMAGMFAEVQRSEYRVLDAGAGVGTLAAAICERFVHQAKPSSVDFDLWDSDPSLEPFLRRTMEHCRQALLNLGHAVKYTIRTDDFILSNGEATLFNGAPTPSFHLAILNPPYYKLRKDSPQAQAMPYVVHGQPNIYALFMAATADLLLPQGQMVAITPRSYFNGPYFKRFRRWFFDRMVARQIHVFESRTEAFRDDGVLQENVILLAEKGGKPRDVALTSSIGRLFPNASKSMVPYNRVIDNSSGDHLVRVATNDLEQAIVATVDNLPQRFRDLALNISTGPVVTFRSTEFLRADQSYDTAPLLWMHNVRPFVTQFLQKNGKPTHILVNDESKRLLVPAKRYVLLKRFTSKEEKKRLVAGIVEAKDSYSSWLGLENHLNYVYRSGKEMSRAEAFGLAAYFNSELVDRYFRAISGNTQVNASEIRAMPVPDELALARIGSAVESAVSRDRLTIENIVGSALNVPSCLIAQLNGAAK